MCVKTGEGAKVKFAHLELTETWQNMRTRLMSSAARIVVGPRDTPERGSRGEDASLTA